MQCMTRFSHLSTIHDLDDLRLDPGGKIPEMVPYADASIVESQRLVALAAAQLGESASGLQNQGPLHQT
jgi:hypothetical protein